MSNPNTQRKPQGSFVAKTVVSHTGAVMKVTKLELSKTASAMLRSQSEGIRTGQDDKSTRKQLETS